MRILIYDVETSNVSNIGSICAVGWIQLNNDEQISSGYTLINPNCSFDQKNISIHGITAEAVKNAPLFSDYWNDTLHDVMSKSLVIAHSAGFDLSATEQALFAAGLQDDGIDYIDSIQICRHFLPDEESYRLCDLASKFSYFYSSHNALEDVKALLKVLISLRDINGLEDLASLLVRSNAVTENTLTNRYLPHRIIDKNRFRTNPRCHDVVDTINDSLAGIKICITGDIGNYERADLERMIMERSGRMTSAVSGKTDYLVVGSYPDRSEGFISGKHKTALTLIEEGAKVRIISPEEFFAMLK